MLILLSLPFIVIAVILAIILIYNGINENNYVKIIGGCTLGLCAAFAARYISNKNLEQKLLPNNLALRK